MGEKSNHHKAYGPAGVAARIAAGVGAAALLLGGVQVVTAGAAAAAAGLVRAAATSATNSVNKSQTVMCPAGKKVLGGAGRVDGGAAAGEVGLLSATPLASGAGFTVRAAEDADGTGGTWSLTAIAFCAPAPAGLQYVSHTFTAGSTKSRWSSITCPKGTKVLGAGATITGGDAHVLLGGIRPEDNDRTVTATGYEDEAGTTANWSVTATATCVSSVQGLEIAQAATAQSVDASVASATLTCPTGTSLYGVGGEVVGGNGEVLLRQLDATPASQARTNAAEDATGYGNPWSVRTYAICAK
jgi:hypothetical protein